jgi:hypothetical protein
MKVARSEDEHDYSDFLDLLEKMVIAGWLVTLNPSKTQYGLVYEKLQDTIDGFNIEV